jgi:alpha-N-acetylglucosaminidase
MVTQRHTGTGNAGRKSWTGLIGTYYAERWEMWLNAEKEDSKFEMLKWEEEWIRSEYKNDGQDFDDSVNEIIQIINN